MKTCGNIKKDPLEKQIDKKMKKSNLINMVNYQPTKTNNKRGRKNKDHSK